MKEFEKWFNEEPTENEKGYCMVAWRAALMWILTHKKPIKYNDYRFDYIKTDVIEEELNATSEKRC